LDVAVAGSFNNWEPQAMAKGQDGTWCITLQVAPGTHHYRFLVGTHWREDPNNERKVQSQWGTSTRSAT
jgi:1,4-alpha-glucan branching enzyme